MRRTFNIYRPGIFIVSFLIAVFSLLNLFVSLKARPFLEEQIAFTLKRKTLIGSVSSSNLIGLRIKDIVIYNVTNEHPLYYFKEIKIRPSLLSLIFKRKLKFNTEIFPTKKFRAHIYAIGDYDFIKKGLFIKFRLRDIPYTQDFGSIYGTLHLYRKPGLKKDEPNVDLLDITFTSQKMLLALRSAIHTLDGKTHIRGTLASPFIKTDKFQLANIISDVALVGDKLYLYNFAAGAYTGTLELDGYVDLDKPVNPTSLSANFKNIDVGEFSRTSSLVKKGIKGKANANVKLKGLFGETNSILGKAYLEIKDADVWESSIFKGVADTLVIPALKTVTFTSAYGQFEFKNSRLYAEDFKLVSDKLELLVKGSLGLDDSLDANVRIKLKNALIDSSPGLTKISTMLLESAGQFFGHIKITGTLKEPTFTVIPVGLENVFEKVKKVIDTVIDIVK